MKPSEDDKQSVEAVVQECTLSFGKSESCPSAGIGSDEAEESDEDMGFGLFDTPPPREITPPEGCHSRFFSHYSRERGGSPTKENGRGRGGRRTTPPSQSRETATRSAGSPAQSASLAQFLLVRLFAFTTSDMSNPSDRQLHLLAVPMVCSVQWHRLVRPLSLVQRRSKNVLRPLAPPKEITDMLLPTVKKSFPSSSCKTSRAPGLRRRSLPVPWVSRKKSCVQRWNRTGSPGWLLRFWSKRWAKRGRLGIW